jgi:cell division protein FtsZ
MNFYFNPNSDAPLIMEEMNEIQEFMANFDPDLDVIWGTAFDETLADQIKVTVLAAGFNVSLDKEAPVSTVQMRREQVVTSPAMSDTERLTKEYGDKAINEYTLKQLSARYIVLQPEEMDDDDVIDLLEKTPTYGRRPDLRNQIKDRQHASSMDRPVEVPKSSRRPAATGDSQTIDFGEN